MRKTGPIPMALGELDALRYLSLDGNNLSGTIPDVFYDLSGLGMCMNNIIETLRFCAFAPIFLCLPSFTPLDRTGLPELQ